MKKVAIKIKYLRENKGLTQSELGVAVGYDQSRVAKWENGSLEPNVDTLIELAKIFGVSVGYLVGAEGD